MALKRGADMSDFELADFCRRERSLRTKESGYKTEDISRKRADFLLIFLLIISWNLIPMKIPGKTKTA